MKRTLTLFICLFCIQQTSLNAQKYKRQDTIRGSITSERSWWDLTYYDLEVSVDPKSKTIDGKNSIHYKVLKTNKVMQIDLQPPMQLTKAIQNGRKLKISNCGNAHYIHLEKPQIKYNIDSLTVFFKGIPRQAIRAPWDGGFSWKKDKNGTDFIATTCQGIGASVWWPNKDHMYDEVDSMKIRVNVPKHLVAVSNGRLIDTSKSDKSKSYTWFVSNPINNYGVNINIGDYVNFSETYEGEKGKLNMSYYVLKHHLEKAKKQFLEAPKMMRAFEHWLGPYPFYEDSYKLVEVPYLGMEHQSSVTYGNQFKNGYLGTDLSATGWGLKFDFIIVHESGHEWFANNITNKDIADMWIHEGFTSYAENLFLDYYHGKEAAAAYVIGTRKRIQNDRPLIGDYNVNNEGSSDIYYKGANMIHMLRQLTKDDEKWRQILRKMNSKFYHQTVTTQQIEDFLSKEIGRDLNPFFNQYLRDTRIPVLEYKITEGKLNYRWNNVVSGFDMPVEIAGKQRTFWIYPRESWNAIAFVDSEIKVDINYYVKTKQL